LSAAPVVLLATLLSYEELKRIAPWLAKLIDMSPHLQAFVQNTLPSTAIIAVNAVLPFLLEGELRSLENEGGRGWWKRKKRRETKRETDASSSSWIYIRFELRTRVPS